MIASASNIDCGNYDIRVWTRHGSHANVTYIQRAKSTLRLTGRVVYALVHFFVLTTAALFVIRNLVSPRAKENVEEGLTIQLKQDNLRRDDMQLLREWSSTLTQRSQLAPATMQESSATATAEQGPTRVVASTAKRVPRSSAHAARTQKPELVVEERMDSLPVPSTAQRTQDGQDRAVVLGLDSLAEMSITGKAESGHNEDDKGEQPKGETVLEDTENGPEEWEELEPAMGQPEGECEDEEFGRQL